MYSYLPTLLLSIQCTVLAASFDNSLINSRATCKGTPSTYNDTVRE